MRLIGMKISICIPSYRRPKVETLDYVKNARVYVDHKEFDEYVKSNPEGSDIVSCPEGVQGNVARIRNYILDQEFQSGVDVVVLLDDDMKGVYRWENKKAKLIEGNQLENFIMKYSIMARDMGVYYWGVNINQDKQVYREYQPFSFLSFLGGPFQCFLNDGGLRYDERLPLKEDYDMTIQQLNKYRRVLRVNFAFYVVKQSINSGGCATYRNVEREEQQLNALIKKWGSKIVKRDKGNRSHNMKSERKHIDYNPIIKVPIKGI